VARLGRLRAVRDRGAAAVEFALVTVPLFLILFGIIQFGFVFYSQIKISQSAREGARLISLNIHTSTPGTCDSDCVSYVKDRMADYASPLVTLTDSSYDTFDVCQAGWKQDHEAVVTVHYTVSIGLLFDVTVHGRASMPCGG
jgi:Flp pilus assembly protein TadG